MQKQHFRNVQTQQKYNESASRVLNFRRFITTFKLKIIIRNYVKSRAAAFGRVPLFIRFTPKIKQLAEATRNRSKE